MISSSRSLPAAVLVVALGATAAACGADQTPQAEQSSQTPQAESVDNNETPPTTQEPTTTLTAPPVEQPADDAEIGEEFIGDTLATSGDALGDPSTPTDLGNVLDGAALEEAQAQRVEMNNSGLHQEGEPEVLSSELVEESDTERLYEVCVDNSQVRTLDENGNQVNPVLEGDEARAKMLLTFTKQDDVWKLSNTSFPNDPSC